MTLLQKIGFFIVGLVLIGALFSYFGSPNEISPIKIVDADAEVSRPEFKGRVDESFGDTVINSTWAMVLIHSEFSKNNASGLEALRNWAKQEFIQDRQFLNPLNLPHSRSNSTIVDSLFNSLFGFGSRYLESSAAAFLNWRTSQFQQTNAYQSFRIDYYELFGVSQESAKLLYRYQEERAIASISVLISAFIWLAFFTLMVGLYVTRRLNGQYILSCTWLALAAFYLYNACSLNNVVILTGALATFITGIFLAFPLTVKRTDKGTLSWIRYELSARALVLLCWMTLTLVCIQVVNWIKGGIFTEPDPLTLFIGAITGNFIHDPVGIKRSVLEILGVSWSCITIWAFYYYKRGTQRSREIETELRSLGRKKISIQ